MMDTRIIDGIAYSGASISEGKPCPDDDFVDRMNHMYTMNLLTFFTAIVLSRQVVGKPISCWIPNDFTGAQGEYAETVCWVTSTYFIAPEQTTVPLEEDIRYEKKIYYYQWVPFILMIQAALFVLPCIIWRLLSTQSKINLRTVMNVSSELKDLSDSLHQRRNLIDCLINHLEDILAIRHFKNRHYRDKRMGATDQRQCENGWSQITRTDGIEDEEGGTALAGGKGNATNGKHTISLVPLSHSRPCKHASSAYLSCLYLAMKALYLLNSASQLYLTGKYLNGEAFIFGIEALRDLMNTRFWDQSGSFPRVALCDFELRRMGSNQHRYTIQCVLRINLFNEKIYIFLWFWFFFVSILNFLSLLRWCYKLLLSTVRAPFIRNLISVYFNITDAKSRVLSEEAEDSGKQQNGHLIPDILRTGEDLQAFQVFAEKILGQDGVLLLRFVDMNVGRLSAAELAGMMWIRYRKIATSFDKTTPPGADGFVFSNISAGPPAIPLKPAMLLGQRPNTKPLAIAPFRSLIYQSSCIDNDDRDSERSSYSSRPTIEMLHERRRYRPMYRRRDTYSSEENDEIRPTSVTCYMQEDFFVNREIPETDAGQEPENLDSEDRSFCNY